MKNRWEQIDDETIKIWLQKRRKDGVQMHTYISPEDFGTVNAYPNSWYASLNSSSHHWYVKMDLYPGSILHGKRHGKRQKVRLHRIICGLTEWDGEMTVDHIIRLNTLDNRRSNLRVCTVAENNQNSGITRSNTGVRGVHYHVGINRFMVRVGPHYLGVYETLEEAMSVADEARKELQPFYVEQ